MFTRTISRIKLGLTAMLLSAALYMSALSTGANADFDKGMAAYEAGDYQTALAEWRPQAEAGDTDAQYNLGLMYYEGECVPQDYAEAAIWYRRAAEQGVADAQNNLGVIYERGHGVPQDYLMAHMWYNLVGSGGSGLAQKKPGPSRINYFTARREQGTSPRPPMSCQHLSVLRGLIPYGVVRLGMIS